MTTTHHPKIIVAAIVSGALALAAPAGASVLNPMTDSWNAGGSGVQTVNATYQPSSNQTDPATRSRRPRPTRATSPVSSAPA